MRPSIVGFLVLAASSIVFTQSAEAQADRHGRLEGTVTDSVHTRPLAGVRVVALAADARPDSPHAASTDSLGRYRIDSLRPGRYLVGLESPLLDSLEITLSPREVAVPEGAVATSDLALPPAAKLRSAVCSGVTLPADRGVLYGHVVDAATEAPLAGAVVTVAWRELTVDKVTLRSESNLRTASVAADSAGWYRVCGVPTGTWLSFLLQHRQHSGSAVRTIVDDSLGIAIRHLSLDLTGPADDTSAATPTAASGTARLTGVIRGPAGQPLSSAEVWVLGTNASTRSDESGQFMLGNLPAGTQVIGVRRVGYSPAEASFELRSHATVNGSVRMERVVMLDSIRVVAMRNRYPEFERARKRPGGGRFIGPEEMEWYQRYPLMSDVLRILGFTIVGDGMFARAVGGQGASFGVSCAPNVVVNGVEGQLINDVNPRNVGAIAISRRFGSGPLQYDTRCGVIEIWTKR
jgi:hypothetical protein